MKKKIISILIVVIITVFVVNFSIDSSEEKDNMIFHATLADSNLYINGVYTDTFTIDKGEYSFRFVPNGSSPEILSIILNGENFDFSEDFKLQSTSHQTGVSEYFTWNYDGQKNILISEVQQVSIIINPNGNVMGSVSVDILEN
ncbi:MAG: hypothetical protein ISR80_02570 [Nitrosopumilus sp.]|nr:hypothetical protein [Nitrosopumilus sp.]MDC4231353.1 hypothetical protein [Nitrosopumilus sp.]